MVDDSASIFSKKISAGNYESGVKLLRGHPRSKIAEKWSIILSSIFYFQFSSLFIFTFIFSVNVKLGFERQIFAVLSCVSSRAPPFGIGDRGYPRDLKIPIPGIRDFWGFLIGDFLGIFRPQKSQIPIPGIGDILGILRGDFLGIFRPRKSQIPIPGIGDILGILLGDFLRIFGDSKSPVPTPGISNPHPQKSHLKATLVHGNKKKGKSSPCS